MAAGPAYTADELERAWKLRRSGLTWAAVGKRIGRPENSLTITANSYRKGTWAPHRLAERSLAAQARVEALVASGVTTIDAIARDLKVSNAAAVQRLMRMGLDAEMRREAALTG
jgi:hypothetical protein